MYCFSKYFWLGSDLGRSPKPKINVTNILFLFLYSLSFPFAPISYPSLFLSSFSFPHRISSSFLFVNPTSIFPSSSASKKRSPSRIFHVSSQLHSSSIYQIHYFFPGTLFKEKALSLFSCAVRTHNTTCFCCFHSDLSPQLLINFQTTSFWF